MGTLSRLRKTTLRSQLVAATLHFTEAEVTCQSCGTDLLYGEEDTCNSCHKKEKNETLSR